MSSDSPTTSSALSASDSRVVIRASWLAIAIGLAIVLPSEFRRWLAEIVSGEGWLNWFTVFDADTTFPLFAFLLLPLFWVIRSRWKLKPKPLGPAFQSWLGYATKPGPETKRLDALRALLLASLAFFLSLAVSGWIGATRVPVAGKGGSQTFTLKDLPPALHDEYSHLFQARTFLAGRLAWPGREKHPGLFDQMHVLNDNGVFAGRYFPGTAFWMAPFVAIGEPHWGHWLASALSAAFVFFIGRELAGNGVGLLAGLLAAVSPGIQTFAQMLLAHQTTLLGLTFFTWMFLWLLRTKSCSSAVLAGSGLAFAMLCRPMTAAGVGLPFGIWFAWWWLRGSKEAETFTRRTLVAAALGLPIALGIGGMMIYNNRLTGDPFVTPYQLYTEIYTPRHVYGFNNVNRAAGSKSDKILENYDRWAENLTPTLAAQNVKTRVIASGRWVLGLVILAMVIGAFPFLAGRKASAPYLSDRRWWLILAAVISLHLAHVPYWFAGIRDWHYVFESAPYLLLIAAGVTACFWGEWRIRGRVGMIVWWSGFLVLSLWMSYGPLPGDSGPPLVQSALVDDIWARRNYATFDRLLEHAVTDRPALVLIAGDPSDRHMDFVTNRPDLESEILRGRFRPDQAPLEDVLESFSDRSIYVVVLNPKLLSEIEADKHAEVTWERLAEENIASGKAVVYRVRPRSSNA